MTSDKKNLTVTLEDNAGGIDEEIIEKIIPDIYPNPANAILYIDYLPDNNDAEYTISNMSGKILSSGILNNPIHGIDIAKYSNGIYMIRIEDGSKHFTAKFVKH